jgi:hypothetical protein
LETSCPLNIDIVWQDSNGQVVQLVSGTGAIEGDEGEILLADLSTRTTANPDGSLSVAILASDTSAMGVTEHGKWSFTVTTASGEIETILQGSVIVRDNP